MTALDFRYIFINVEENIKAQLESGVGTSIMSKDIEYVFGGQIKEITTLPAICIEELTDYPSENFNIGGVNKYTFTFTVWIHAGGYDDENKNEGMKKMLKGLVYNTFSKKYSLPFLDYINDETETGCYYQTDIEIRGTTPSIYSVMDAHKCVGTLTFVLIF